MRRNLLILILLSCVLNGCILFKNLDKALEDTAVRLENRYDVNLDSIAKDLGKNLITGATDGLSSDESKANLEKFLGNILSQFSDSLAIIISESKDSLFNKKTDKLLKARIESLGHSLKLEVEELLGGPLNQQTSLFINNVIDQFTNQQTIDRFKNLRDSLLGDELKTLTDSIVRSAVRSAIDEFDIGYENKLKGKIDSAFDKANDFEEKTTKDLVKIILIAGVIVLILITAYFYLRAKRNRDVLKVINFEIDKIDERHQYDSLVGRIKQNATGKGLGKHLDQVLKDQELYQQPHWLDKNKQLLDLIVASLQDTPDETSKNNILNEIKSNAEKSGLMKDVDEVFNIKK